jgi:hypothetical protein
MDLVLKTWNSLNINDGSPFNSTFPEGQKVNISSNPVMVNRAGDFPYLSGTVLNASTLAIEVRIAAGQDLDVNREKAKRYFNPMDAQRHNLVAWDADNGNEPMYVTGKPIRISQPDKVTFVVIFQLEYPYWKLVTAETDTWNITASAQTHAVINSGNILVPPSFTFTPTTAASGGLSYRRWVPIYNNMDTSYIDALDITGGGLDTATLTTAKMQADGDDFTVWMNGTEADRWLNAMDSAATKCWVNLRLSPRKEGTTLGTIANTSAATTVTFTRTKANQEFLQSLKRVQNRVLLVDSEALTFEADNVDLYSYQITSCTRARKGTTAATHTQPKTVRHIEHDIWICYGDSTRSAPDVDDDYKPMWNLSSTNAARAYTYFNDPTANRPGAWKGEVLESKSGQSYIFTANQNTFATTGATEMGVALIGSDDFRVMNEVGTVAWTLTHPAGFTNVVFSGDKYATTNNAGSFPVVCGLQYLQPDAVWFTQQNESAPLLASVWEPFGPHTEALGDTYETIRFVIDGTLDSTLSAKAMAQFDTVTVTLDSNNLPTISVGAEQAAYEFDFVLANTTTSESLRCNVPLGLSETLEIDCENKAVSLSGGGRAVVTFSSDREDWLNLAVGSNTLQFTDAGTAGVTLGTEHRDRTL